MTSFAPASLLRWFLACHPGVSTSVLGWVIGRSRQTTRSILAGAAPLIVALPPPPYQAHRLGRPPRRWMIDPRDMRRYRPAWGQHRSMMIKETWFSAEVTEWVAVLHALALWCPSISGCSMLTFPTFPAPNTQVAVVTGAGWIDYQFYPPEDPCLKPSLFPALPYRVRYRTVFVGCWIPAYITPETQIARIRAAINILQESLPIGHGGSIIFMVVSDPITIPTIHHLVPVIWASLQSNRTIRHAPVSLSVMPWTEPSSVRTIDRPTVTTWHDPHQPPVRQSIVQLITGINASAAMIEQWRTAWIERSLRFPPSDLDPPSRTDHREEA